jgi:26S proteasome regulatory subunit N9
MQTELSKRVNKPASQDAYVFAQVAVSLTFMNMKDLPKSRELLDECEKILDGFDSVETVVHASFYRQNASYYKVYLLSLLLLLISNDC